MCGIEVADVIGGIVGLVMFGPMVAVIAVVGAMLVVRVWRAMKDEL